MLLKKWFRTVFNRKESKYTDKSQMTGQGDIDKDTNEMSKIYREKLWGGKKFDFYSGQGSHSKKVVRPYVGALKKFLTENGGKLVVCDLGCGDFNVGNQLVPFVSKYIAVDVVEDLITRNKQLFHHENLTFTHLDLVEDELPKGDVALIRQVLQHLSNNDISRVVEKFKAYKYIFATEHVPVGKFTPNLDKDTGVGTRLSRGSGVVLDAPPFNLKSKSVEIVLDIKYNKGRIVTTKYEL